MTSRPGIRIGLLVFGLIMGLTAEACPDTDAGCWRAQGERFLAAGAIDNALFALERAAMIRPDNLETLQLYAQALAAGGAQDSAYALLGNIAPVSAPGLAREILNTPRLIRPSIEWGLAYSTNRAQQPRLDSLHLDLPGGGVQLPLAEPRQPRPGLLYGMFAMLPWASQGTLHAQLQTSPDGNFGHGWLRVENAIDADGAWRWRADGLRRLDNGYQLSTAVARRWLPFSRLQAEAELGLRQETGSTHYHWTDARVAILGAMGPLQALASITRAIAINGEPPGSDQWRMTASLFGERRLDNTDVALVMGLQMLRDDETFHPWLAHGARRWQAAGQISLRARHHVAERWHLWGQALHEERRSNIALYAYRRSEIWIGLGYAF